MPARPSRLQVLMEMAKVQASRGTCSRLQVGTLIHRDGRILSTGYNGAPSGVEHCSHDCNCSFARSSAAYHQDYCSTKQPCTIAAHAERNAIDWAARHGIRLEGSEIVTTDTPCASCAGSIINAGIVRVVALRAYRDPLGSSMLASAGVSMDLYEEVL